MSRDNKITESLIRRKWRKREFEKRFERAFKEKVALTNRKMECLKDSYKSSIWKLEIKAGEKKIPIILKIFKPLREERPESTVEKNVYRRAKKYLQPFMPQIYCAKRNILGHDLWVFMEYIEVVKGRVTYGPDYFPRIIPTLAKLHAATLNGRNEDFEALTGDWLPRYDSREFRQQRAHMNEQTSYYLEQAMKSSALRPVVGPYYELVRKMLKKGPTYFPEVEKAGLSIIHGDLHTANMVCSNLDARSWNVKFIDWEGAKFVPCWFDLVNLVGVFLAYRTEWRDEEEAITRRCVELYAKEMKKQGIEFAIEPLKLYRMAYLKRVLERGLYLQLNWAVTGKKEAKLLKEYLKKIQTLGQKTGLI